MSKNLFVILFFMIIEVVFVFAEITSTHTLDEKNCKFSIQVNEDNKILFAETQKIPGHYGTIGCYETSNTGCLVNTSTEEYKKGTKELSSQTFESLSGQVCYFQAFDILSGSTGCWNGGLYYVYALRYRVSCEDSTSIPTYCAKSEGFAKQVLLTRQELKCAEKGGVFEGGVYPFTQQDGSKIYCVSATCETCESKWRDDYMNHWKDSVCCDERKREPNSNNGTCQKAGSMDSTKIGVKNSKITGLPGCSKKEAGLGSNYCQIPQSSSSIPSSSSSSAFSSSSYSSSSEEISSSSEEQEKADCYTTGTDANAALFDAEWKCSRLGKNPDYEIDYYNCLVGECIEVSSSSHQEDNNDDDSNYSSSEIESSSSVPELCRYENDVLRKEDPNEELNTWTYVGREKYNNREMASITKKKSSNFFDVLGRAYKKTVSQIKYFMGKETEIKTKVEVSEELEVFKKVLYDLNGNEINVYRKKEKNNKIIIDSTYYSENNWTVFEINNVLNETILKLSGGALSYRKYDNRGRLIINYLVKEDNDTLLYEEYEWNKGRLVRMRENDIIRIYKYGKNISDTVHVIPTDYGIRLHQGYDGTAGIIPDENDSLYRFFIRDPYSYRKQKKEVNSLLKNVMLKLPPGGKRNFYCKEINEKKGMPIEECIRYTKNDVNNNGNILYGVYPNKKNLLLYGESYGEPSPYFGCICENGKYYAKHQDIVLFEYIQIVKSGWRYNKSEGIWKEFCWTNQDIQSTYDHEVMHIENIRKKITELSKKYYDNAWFETYIECKTQGDEVMDLLFKEWDQWSELERKHENKEWKGIKYGQYRAGEKCQD